MKKNKEIIFLIFLVVLLLAINYSFFDSLLINFLDEGKTVVVERVIDGDTIVIENKTSVRLLGINSPERNEPHYKEAKDYLNDLILNKTIKIEFGKDKYDRYQRILGYVFVNGKNVNLELVEEGFANFYFPSGKDIYYEDFKKAWEECIKDNKNLCEISKHKCIDCIELKKFEHKNQIVIFYNKCSFDCDMTGWEIKDEGRKNFVFPEFILKKNKEIEIKVGDDENNKTILFWENEKYVWTKSGDTLFLRDEDGKLVLWESY